MILINTWKSLFSLLIIFLLQYIFPLSNYAMKNMLSFELEQNQPLLKPDHILSITGISSDRLDTDIILLSISIQTLDLSLSASYQMNTLSSNKVSNVLKQMQIPDRNVTTKSYYTEKQFKSIFVPANNTYIDVFEGYKIVNSLEIRLSDVNTIPSLIDSLIQAGNVLVNKIEFQLSRGLKKMVSDRILREAASDALERATVTAETLDLTIADVKKIDVREALQIIERDMEEHSRSKSRGAAAKAVPTIFSGTSQIETRILVDFIIKK